MTLLIATPGPQRPADDVLAAHALPELPVLAAMLTRARRLSPAVDWRAGVLDGLGVAATEETLAAVAVAARAVPGLSAGTALCFAAPLHVVAGISRVYLPPGGWLRLDAAEVARWAEAFNREFGDPQVQLHVVTGGWLLAAPCAVATHDAAPELLIGEPLARTSARDESERDLRRLGAEVEIWLANHPLNREREALQLLPVNCMWFWGGAQAREIPQLARSPRAIYVAGDPDAWLAGLAAHCAVPLHGIADWRSLSTVRDALLVLAPQREGASPEYWRNLEIRWFEPAARALGNGNLDALRLQIGSSAWHLPDHSPLRWLRRVRPWYRQVMA